MAKAHPHDPGVGVAGGRAEEAGDAARSPIKVGKGQVRFGTASWTDPTMTVPGASADSRHGFGEGRLPAQTAFWESISVPGIYFAGTINQGAKGLMKHGMPSNSGAAQGYRYNARVLARHLAETQGIEPERPTIAPNEVIPTLLHEARHGPELWHQRSYLTRVISFDGDRGIVDEGIVPLVHFLDGGPFDRAAAITLESNGREDLYPVVYVRHGGKVHETRLPDDPFLNFETAEHRETLAAALEPLLSPSLSQPRT